MTKLEIHNPFNAPVYHEETVTSTMDVSRELAASGEPHGTVIAADFQEKGRGRIRDRKWEMERGNLPFTILLHYPRIEEIPQALTLRAGLAAALAIEDFCPSLKNTVMIKWPNDLFIGSKKTAGILCEADGGNVHIGIGINFAQKLFPDHLREKATSIALAAGRDFSPCDRLRLLERVLVRLHAELETAGWRERLQQRLYKNGEQVVFVEGAAGSKNSITGCLAGIGEGGELLIVPDGEREERCFITGELL
ncbi:MAG: biotin--[acetyl-CoA-carboxylase] ligase [Treponema sp.]|jgi:BirA family biotin operon repressor/biotin-[acetyl-CoA-carboxylase] ligase|nr:biotin--[acetyl-CoA-carboxylase] ligase [Treponema sp.]